MYDKGNDDWLKMNGNPNEWAVGFHGSRTTEGNQGISTTRTFFTNSGVKLSAATRMSILLSIEEVNHVEMGHILLTKSTFLVENVQIMIQRQ